MAAEEVVLGRFYDGEGGLRLDVTLQVDKAAETLRLGHADLPHGSQYWPLPAIRELRGQARRDVMVLALFDDGALDGALIKTARLSIDDPDLASLLRARCPNLARRDMPRGTARKTVWRAGAAAAALGIMIFVILPGLANLLAPLIPIDRETAWGRTVVAQMERFLGGRDGSLSCSHPEGTAALDLMIARLTSGTPTQYDLNVRVLDHKMVNAFAAPGGQIVLMRGLIEAADRPEEVAAVLAHEIGHVEARDVTRGALRSAGSAGLLSLVIGDFAGGTLAVAGAEYMLNTSYTREAEIAADNYALAMLRESDVDMSGMADFFDKLTALQDGQGPALPEYLSTHPETAARAETARDGAVAQRWHEALLSDSQWQALRAICLEPKG